MGGEKIWKERERVERGRKWRGKGGGLGQERQIDPHFPLVFAFPYILDNEYFAAGAGKKCDTNDIRSVLTKRKPVVSLGNFSALFLSPKFFFFLPFFPEKALSISRTCFQGFTALHKTVSNLSHILTIVFCDVMMVASVVHFNVPYVVVEIILLLSFLTPL